MSAYQVEPTTIDLIVSYANPLDPQQIGEMLWEQNKRSVAFRYDEPIGPAKYTFTRYKDVRPLVAFGCAQCYDYQACETPDYDASPACLFILQAIQRACGELIRAYPWGVETPQEAISKGYACV